MDMNKIYDQPPTLRLYNQAPYLSETHATVLYAQDNIAIFDQTIFYAESGGQIFDIGMIDGFEVVNVQKRLGTFYTVPNPKMTVPSVKIDTRIVHEFNEPVPFKAGDKVTMSINWPRRYRIMKHHTLSHFLFHGITQMAQEAGLDLFLKGCSINEEKGVFSLNNAIDETLMERIQTITRDALAQGGEILMEAEPTTDEVYYWQHKEIIIPCGGTHVNTVEECGQNVVIGKKSQGKGKCKIYIKMAE